MRSDLTLNLAILDECMTDRARFKDHICFASHATLGEDMALKLGKSKPFHRETVRRLQQRLTEGSGKWERCEEAPVKTRTCAWRIRHGATRIPFTNRKHSTTLRRRSSTYRTHYVSSVRTSSGRRQRWRSEVGEVVPIGAVPEKTNAAAGQALFAAIIDQFSADGIAIPRAQIAIAAKHGSAALKDGVDPKIVLAGCVTSIRRGRPEIASKVIMDISLAAGGQLMNTHEYNRELQRISSESDPVQKRFGDAMRAITEGRNQ